jgi:Cu/Ag efflux pump CusA
LAFAYIIALLASLVVAIVVTPALSYAFLPNAPSISRGHDGWLARTLKAWFGRVLPHALNHPHMITATSRRAACLAGFAMTQMGTGFLQSSTKAA